MSCLNNPDHHLMLIRVASDTHSVIHFCICTPIRCLVLSFKCSPLVFFWHWGGMVLNNSILCTLLSWASWVRSSPGTSLAVQRLGLHTSPAAGDMGLIPGQGTKILHSSLVFGETRKVTTEKRAPQTMSYCSWYLKMSDYGENCCTLSGYTFWFYGKVNGMDGWSENILWG